MQDMVVVGGGIVGLAVAYKALLQNPELRLTLIEKELEVATHQSGRNSGVLHSGIYYKPGSLKAKNCVDGYGQLFEFCKRHGVDYQVCGKLIVAHSDKQVKQLDELKARGKANGLEGLDILDEQEARSIEPHIRCKAALRVPQTGIIDFKKVAKKLQEVVQNMGGKVVLGEEVAAIQPNADSVEVTTNKNKYLGKILINCAGLFADRVAELSGASISVRIFPFRGEYFNLKERKASLVNNLIYPVPNPEFPFLGVHLTRAIDDRVEAGPNAVLALAREAYKKSAWSFKDILRMVTWVGFYLFLFRNRKLGFKELIRSHSRKLFASEVRQLIPEISDSDLSVGKSGVRAQALSRSGQLVDDFLIQKHKRCVHVLNAPSPAATSCLSIADYILEAAND